MAKPKTSRKSHDASKPKSWRDILPVHPAAGLFPLMEGAEFDTLVEDIKQNGLLFPIIIWHDVAGEQYLLDGRNRLRALFAAGIKPDEDHFRIVGHCESTRDPYALVVSLNINRRRLTSEQNRELIGKLLQAAPGKSDRQIGRMAKVDSKTVAAVRAKQEAREEISHVETRTTARAGTSRRTSTRRSPLSDMTNSASAMVMAIAAQTNPPRARGGAPRKERDSLRKVSLDDWKALSEQERSSLLNLDAAHNVSFNKQENEAIEWARWSWNPVTGCQHNCSYCYARDIANSPRMAKACPSGFEPTFRPSMLLAPRYMKVPGAMAASARCSKVVISCSPRTTMSWSGTSRPTLMLYTR